MRKSYYELSTTRFPSKYWHMKIINTARIMLIRQRVAGPILDLGCGDGVRVRLIFGEHIEIHGVDNDPEMVEFAKKRLNKVYLSSVENIPQEILDNKYNTIVLMESLEHIPNVETVLKIANKLLADNGLLIVIIPLETVLFRIIWWLWTMTMGKRWRKTHLTRFKSAQQLFSMLENWFKILDYKKINLGCILITICGKNVSESRADITRI